MSLTVSPAVAEQIRPGEWTPIQVVEGTPCPGSPTSCPPFTRAMCRYGGNPHPPADLVALRDARCETCDETGVVNCPRHLRQIEGRCDTCWTVEVYPCPDCHDGRKLVEVRVPCPHGCYPIGSGVCSFCGSLPNGPEGPHRNIGYRTLHGLIDVVPITSVRGVTPAHVAALEADLGRPIAPGMFAVTFTEVDQ